MDRLANHPIYHFWQTIVFVISAGGPVLNLIPGPGLGLNGLDSEHDKKFISSEVRRLLTDGLIEPSNSPWRAQPFIVTPENHKKRMVIDYSQTINKFTQADTYPLPRIQDVVNNVAKFKVYSTLDMSSAYHQVELPECDRK